MSVNLQRLAWRVEFPSSAMSAVAVKLADCANDDGEHVYPSVARIARETRLGVSTVRRVLAAFEEAGLVEVVSEATGNGYNRSTTDRTIVLERLHDLTAVEARRNARVVLTPSTHVLKQIAAVDGKRRWAIVPRSGDDPSDYDEPSTPPAAGGVAGCRPSQSGRGPLPERDPTPPAAGPYPSRERSLKEETPPNPLEGEGERAGVKSSGDEGRGAKRRTPAVAHVDGWAAGWTPQAVAEVQALRGTAAGLPMALLFERIGGVLQPPAGVDAVAYVKAAAKALAEIDAAAVAALAERLPGERDTRLPGSASLLAMAKSVSANVRRAARAGRQPQTVAPRPAADPVLAAAWPDMRAMLVGRLGEPVVAQWLDELIPVELADGVLRFVAPIAFYARWVSANHEGHIVTVANAVLGPAHGAVTRVVVETAAARRDAA